MSAPLSGPLFHGTTAKLKKGDIILPRAVTKQSKNFEWDKKSNVAWATDNPRAAHYYAQNSYIQSGYKGSMKVLQVEPINPESVKEDKNVTLARKAYGGGKKPKHLRSEEGFRVVKRHRWK